MKICGKDVRLGDYVVAMYTSGKKFGGGTIRGIVTKMWELPHLQVQLNDAWCFHDKDFIVELGRPTKSILKINRARAEELIVPLRKGTAEGISQAWQARLIEALEYVIEHEQENPWKQEHRPVSAPSSCQIVPTVIQFTTTACQSGKEIEKQVVFKDNTP